MGIDSISLLETAGFRAVVTGENRAAAALKKSIYLMRRDYFLQEQVDDGIFKCISVAGDQNFADACSMLGAKS